MKLIMIVAVTLLAVTTTAHAAGASNWQGQGKAFHSAFSKSGSRP